MNAAWSSRCSPAAGKDARVGQHEIQPAEFGDPLGHRLREPFEVPDVALLGHDAPTGLLDEVHGLVEILRCRHRIGDAVDLVAQVERDDVGAFLGEPDGVGTPLTAGRARDEDDLPIELLCHDAPQYGRAQ